ncbi:MAG: hypothetical protein ACYS5V_16760 [Planctomycetota bacterium]|jgi:hypothetical protein
MAHCDDAKRIQPCAANGAYFQYRGQPVMLLGGSVEDNLFQIPDIVEHLDLLAAVGGNYVRCTMSSRDEGNVWPFERDPDTGLYDLDSPGEEFWGRFSRFLDLTAERDVIVQIEVWATFDYYRDCWDANPFNPKNNVNYTAAESGLPEVVATHPVKTENNFFWSVPAENNQPVVLKYQHAFVDKLLSISLDHGHVLYAMDNETSVTPAWGAYWSEYIKAAAARRGLKVETTEMWDPHDLSHPMHANTIEHPETYSFVDLSQNNHQTGQAHWDNAAAARARVAAAGLRPMTNVKIYGADPKGYGTARDGQERFWRNIFNGFASARFHRPPSGLGLSPTAQAHIRSLRMLTDAVDVFSSRPANDLLAGRADNEAYCLANPPASYAVFFPDGGDVTLDTSAASGQVELRWLDILQSTWLAPTRVPADAEVSLTCPGESYWTVLVKPV